jgi:acyl carrier protein
MVSSSSLEDPASAAINTRIAMARDHIVAEFKFHNRTLRCNRLLRRAIRDSFKIFYEEYAKTEDNRHPVCPALSPKSNFALDFGVDSTGFIEFQLALEKALDVDLNLEVTSSSMLFSTFVGMVADKFYQRYR